MPSGQSSFRCGFVALLGKPNVGKSTLLNRILGQKISITSPKPQTTRNRILGIHNLPQAQVIYMDTPGLSRSGKALAKKISEQAKKAAFECDLAVLMIEANRPWTEQDQKVLGLLERLEKPRILAINKIDKVPKPNLLPLIEHSSRLELFEEIIPLSALKGLNVDRFVEVIPRYLPEQEPLFPPDLLTDQPERFWAAEMVREKVFRLTGEELPYQSAVLVEEFTEKNDLIYLRAVILVERESQKAIIIGKRGAMLKKIGTLARLEMENFFGVKVYLELFVKVKKKWWKDQSVMKEVLPS